MKGDDLLKSGQLTEALRSYYEAYLTLRQLLPDVKDEFAASLVANKVKLTDEERKSVEVLKK